MSDPIRVFIGASVSEWLPAKVLEYSIKLNTDKAVETFILSSVAREFKLPVHAKNQPRTPFSFQRFLIPELCNYKGRAIYLDADMIVFDDIYSLWETDFSGSDLLATSSRDLNRPTQFSVMLLDCEKLNWSIEDIVCSLNKNLFSYEQLMFEFVIAENISKKLSWAWNSMEFFEPELVKLLHFTDMNTQPWVSKKNKNKNIWLSCLRDAISSGFISMADVVREIESGSVRPSILQDISNDIHSLSFIKKTQHLVCDLKFIPPYKNLKKSPLNQLKRFF
jgi:hypothetical protein